MKIKPISPITRFNPDKPSVESWVRPLIEDYVPDPLDPFKDHEILTTLLQNGVVRESDIIPLTCNYYC